MGSLVEKKATAESLPDLNDVGGADRLFTMFSTTDCSLKIQGDTTTSWCVNAKWHHDLPHHAYYWQLSWYSMGKGLWQLPWDKVRFSWKKANGTWNMTCTCTHGFLSNALAGWHEDLEVSKRTVWGKRKKQSIEPRHRSSDSEAEACRCLLLCRPHHIFIIVRGMLDDNDNQHREIGWQSCW